MGIVKTTVRRTELPQKSYRHHTTFYWHRDAAYSDLGNLTQARDLASLIIHCEEHGRRLRRMCLEELQGFVQGLWENLVSGHVPGGRGHALQRVCRAQFSEHSRAPIPKPLPRAGAGPRSLHSEGPKHRAWPALLTLGFAFHLQEP